MVLSLASQPVVLKSMAQRYVLQASKLSASFTHRVSLELADPCDYLICKSCFGLKYCMSEMLQDIRSHSLD